MNQQARILADQRVAPGSEKLLEMARTINELAKQEEDAQLALCRAIANAMDMVREDGRMKWTDWADAYLRKPDGSKWAHGTLYHYASYARDPKKLERNRNTVSRLSREARAEQVILTRAKHQAPESQKAIDHQVRSLMFAWNHASAEARKIFLKKIAK